MAVGRHPGRGSARPAGTSHDLAVRPGGQGHEMASMPTITPPSRGAGGWSPPPSVRARRALAMLVIGLARANACNQPRHGRERDEHGRGEGQREHPHEAPHVWADLHVVDGQADSGRDPREGEPVRPTTRIRATIDASSPTCRRKPISTPTSVMSSTTRVLRTASPSVRPARTAERAMGSERNRSNHALRQDPRPAPHRSGWNRTRRSARRSPHIRKVDVLTPGGSPLMAPPKT